MKTILVTGGAGFIGSHTCVELLKRDYNVVVVDSLINSKREVINKIKQIARRPVVFHERDLTDDISDIFETYDIYAVIHFAGLKAVKESISNPIFYYKTNLYSTINLLETMKKYNCHRLIFSSSATVYGDQKSPLNENMDIGKGITNPYGQTKFMIEQILMDCCKSEPKNNFIGLRYFNPIGAHPSGLIGEDPNDIPNNLMPYILKTAYKNNIDHNVEGFDHLSIYGNNYNTIDGTAVRDYIHVVDLALGHIKALEKIDVLNNYNVFNLGTGKGSSVLEIVNMFIKINKVRLPYKLTDRRDGDLEEVYCETDKTVDILGFKTSLTLEDMCRDAWNFQKG
jgi:UDP-glucose 4-epimerase